MSETGILFLALEGVFSWNKARIKCFSMIVMAMISAQSVNLADVTDHAKPDHSTKYESLYKRIQGIARRWAAFYGSCHKPTLSENSYV